MTKINEDIAYEKKKTLFSDLSHACLATTCRIYSTRTTKAIKQTKKFDVEGDSVQFRTFLVIQAVQTSTEEN